MLRFQRSLAAVTAMLVLLGVCGTAMAAKPRKVYVPGNIIKGASVAKGRAFYSGTGPESSLAGVRLGRPAREILVKWGNPTRITVGTTRTEGAPTGVPTLPVGPQYFPSPTNPYEAITRGPSPYGAPGPAELPTLPGYTAPAPMLTPTPTLGGGTTPVLTQEEVTWTYDLLNGITLEFIVTDGLVTQITAGGEGPWKLSKTRTGLQLGDTYKLVLWVCGYPESQEYAGRFLRARYVSKNHALFTFLRNRLVGITIALVEQELRE